MGGRRSKDNGDGAHQGVNDDGPHGRKAQDVEVHRVNGGTDEVLLRLIVRGHLHRGAEPANPLLGFGRSKGPPQFGLLLVKLGLKIGSQFGQDVFLALPGQVLPNRLKITIEEFHGVFLFGPGGLVFAGETDVAFYKMRVMAALMVFHSWSNWLSNWSPSADKR